MDGTRRSLTFSVLLLLSLLPAWSASAADGEAEPEPLPTAPEPATFPVEFSDPPEWYQTAGKNEIDVLLRDEIGVVSGRGEDAAVVLRHGRYWLAHRRDGVLGIVAVPDDTAWVGLNDEDEVFAATSSGRLYVARNPDAALGEDGFRNLMNIDGATVWEVTPDAVFTATDTELVRIDPDTAALSRIPLPGEGPVRAILGRADGVIVLQAGPEDQPATWISTDLGDTWSPVEEPVGPLIRIGQRIEEKQRKKLILTLAADGRTWLSASPTHLVSRWSSMVDFSHHPHAQVQPPQASHLLPAARPVEGGTPDPPLGTSVDVTMSDNSECEGLACIRRKPVPESLPGRFLYGFFGDGICDDVDANGECNTIEPFTRLPRLARFDRETEELEFVTIPDSCHPWSVRDAGGLGILFCGDTRRANVWIRAPGAQEWKQEGDVPVSVSALDVVAADDGTIFATQTVCPRDQCIGWVRRPAAVGEGTWQHLADDQLAFRAAGAGNVASVDSSGTLTITAADGSEAATGSLPQREDLLDFAMEPGGCVRVVYGAASQSPDEKTEVHGSGLVTTEGDLLEGVDCKDAIEAYETSQRQGLLKVNCGPSGAKANIIGPNDIGVASLDCPAEIALEPGVYNVIVNLEDHQPAEDEVVIEPQQVVHREFDLYDIPIGTISVVGGGFFSGDDSVGIGGGLRATVGISMFDGEYEIGGLFRMAFTENPGYLGAFFANYILRLGDLDFRFGGGLGMGTMRGQGDDDLTSANAITMRYIFTAGMNYRLWGPLALRVYTDAYLTPFVFDAGAGFAVEF